MDEVRAAFAASQLEDEATADVGQLSELTFKEFVEALVRCAMLAWSEAPPELSGAAKVRRIIGDILALHKAHHLTSSLFAAATTGAAAAAAAQPAGAWRG